MKVVLALALFVLSTEALIQCPPNICTMVRCTNAQPCNGKFVQGGGYCGCCDSCINQIAEGDSCFSQILLGVPAKAECELGTHCDPTTTRCVKDAVAEPASPVANTCQQELDQYLGNSQMLLGARKPVCDGNGNYAPKQCSGSQCYCVMKDGKQIEGYSANVWEAQQQTCQCARDLAEYMASGLIGKLFYCSADGSYQKYKCVGSVCFCSDSNGNQMGTQSVNIGEVDKLNC